MKATDNHTHPACQAGAHRHEKVPVGGSAGGEITEGCLEHYDERIVSADAVSEKYIGGENWQKYIVMSEILSVPRCKRR